MALVIGLTFLIKTFSQVFKGGWTIYPPLSALSPLEAVNIFETAKGTKFAIQFMPKEALEAQRDAAQDPLSESFASLMLGIANGSEIDMKNTIDVFPMRLTSVHDYAKM